MPCDYDKIREENIRKYGTETRHLSFLGRLYTDRTHFIFEILQNAEDAGATKVLFQLFNDRLEVTHDGRVFNEDDVRGICGVGDGTKAEDLTQIGKFGIGFKSVYAYTSTPEIHSAEESFKIESYVRPYPIKLKKVNDPWTTLFVFPFDVTEIDQQTAYFEIAKKLQGLSVKTLLFLQNIKEIHFLLPSQNEGFYKRHETNSSFFRKVEVEGNYGINDESENWLICSKTVQVPNNKTEVKVEIAFQLEKNTEDEKEKIVRVRDTPLVVYFPTEKDTRLGFLIQGPYRTTPSRDNVPKEDKWNSVLISETANLLVTALDEIKKIGLLSVSALQTMPIQMDDFPEDSMFYPIALKVKETMQKKKLIPSHEGSFVSAQNAKLARSGDLRLLLQKKELRHLFEVKDPLQWVTSNITQDRTPDLRFYLLNHLNVEEVTPEGVARKLNRSFLENQSDEWMIKLYRFLTGQEALWRPSSNRYREGVLRNEPIIRLQDNKHEKAFNFDGTSAVFLPPQEETEFPIIKRNIAADEDAKYFFKRLGLSEPNIYDEIVNIVLPKYNTKSFSKITDEEHSADIEKIFRALSSERETGKKSVTNAASGVPFLRAMNKHKEIAYKSPVEIYFNSTDLMQFFSPSSDVWFLKEPEIENSDKHLLTKLGVAYLPRRMKRIGSLPESEREYSTKSDVFEDYELDGLSSFLSYLETLSDEINQKMESLILWNILERHLEKDDQFFKGKYKWYYYSEKHKFVDCSIIKKLQNTEWIPTEGGGLKKPNEIRMHQLLEECQDSDRLIKALGIESSIDSAHASERNLRTYYANNLGVTVEDIDFLTKHRSEYEKLKASILKTETKPSFPTRPIKNIERRKEKIDEQLGEAEVKKYEKRKRSIRTSRGSIAPDIWLRNQYTNELGQMICQICQTEMPFKKRNGEYYFEAIEALPNNKEFEAGYLALCPLCAAMYNEFLKHDKEALKDFKASLLSSSINEIPLSLGSWNTTIRFVDTHFHDIKEFIENS